MKPVRQEHGFGCAVACVAFVLQKSYTETLQLFSYGEYRVKHKPDFYCPELVRVLNNNGLVYSWKKLSALYDEESFTDWTIVFIKRSEKDRYGHFLCKYKNQWMDPWINWRERPSKAGFTKTLPGKPAYHIFPFKNIL